MRTTNLIGVKIGRLTALRRAAGKRARDVSYEFLCECGSTTVLPGYSVVSGNTSSCGCLRRETSSAKGRANRVHGHTSRLGEHGRKSPTYSSWEAMRARCSRKSHPHYARYGGRGVTICVEWACFDTFLRDMGPRPAGTSLDRIDNDGGYNKENCRWVDMRTQASNKCNNVVLTFNGESATQSEWARRLGVRPTTLYDRLRSGWSVERAVTTPPNERKRNKKCKQI